MLSMRHKGRPKGTTARKSPGGVGALRRAAFVRPTQAHRPIFKGVKVNFKVGVDERPT